MASALISITGTSGTVLIKYKISTVNHSLISDIANVYIENTATNVTYTTLSGDAVASSLVFTITNLPFTYYKMEWKEINPSNYKISSVLFNNNSYIILESPFPNSNLDIVNSVNNLNVEELKITDYKITSNIGLNSAPDVSYILRVLGTSVPEFKIKNSNNTNFIYVKGILTTYPVTGYTSVQLCNNVLPL